MNLLFFSNYVSTALSVTTASRLSPVRALRVWPLSLGTLSCYPISAPYPGICQRRRFERRSGSVINFNVSWVLRRYFKMSLRERGFCQCAGLVFQKQRRND